MILTALPSWGAAIILRRRRMWWIWRRVPTPLAGRGHQTTGGTDLLVADMMNSSYGDLRRAYIPIIEALDGFLKTQPRAALRALELIQTTKRRSTSNYLFDLFFDAKSREIAAMLADAASQIRLAAYTILSETDQAHLSDYENLQ